MVNFLIDVVVVVVLSLLTSLSICLGYLICKILENGWTATRHTNKCAARWTLCIESQLFSQTLNHESVSHHLYYCCFIKLSICLFKHIFINAFENQCRLCKSTIGVAKFRPIFASLGAAQTYCQRIYCYIANNILSY
jgi:hypothetical protein